MKALLNKKLSIIFLDFDDIRNPLLNAGQARATFEVGRRLVKKGHSVTVITSKFPKSKDRIENGIYYHHIGIGTQNIKVNNAFYILSIPFIVRKLTGDIIVECFTAPISTLLTPLFSNIPAVALPSMFNAKEFSKKYFIPFDWIEKIGIRFYKYIMPYSLTDSAKAKKLNPNILCRIIPQGVGKEYFSVKHKRPKHILFLGRLDIAQKGIDLLLKAYSKVKNSIPYPLVLAGHGPDEEKIKFLIKDLKLKQYVRLVGSTYGQKKIKLLEKTAFVAFPSRHEEMSLWALEALASGFPLVTFDLPEYSWMDKKVGLKIKPFDEDAYAKALIKACNKKYFYKAGVYARGFAQKFTWEKVVTEFEKFFQEIVIQEKENILYNKKKNSTFGFNLYKTLNIDKLRASIIMKKASVSIGIPAFNEEANIKNLLLSILRQKHCSLKEIIVVSDGSTDKTVSYALEVRDKRIYIVDRKNRIGANQTQNEIVKKAKGNILIMLNGDVILRDDDFVEKIIAPILNDKKVGLVGANVISVRPRGLFESIMSTSSELRSDIYRKIRYGINVYTCHGRARAFSRQFYKHIVWPDDCPEDSYSYLRCLEQGYKFAYEPLAKVIFRSSSSLSDHKKQSLRFADGKIKLEKYFSAEFVRKQFQIPMSILLTSILKFLFLHPFETLSYILVSIYLRLLPKNKEIDHSRWEISLSSKNVSA